MPSRLGSASFSSSLMASLGASRMKRRSRACLLIMRSGWLSSTALRMARPPASSPVACVARASWIWMSPPSRPNGPAGGYHAHVCGVSMTVCVFAQKKHWTACAALASAMQVEQRRARGRGSWNKRIWYGYLCMFSTRTLAGPHQQRPGQLATRARRPCSALAHTGGKPPRARVCRRERHRPARRPSARCSP